jgi:hypothetical protein
MDYKTPYWIMGILTLRNKRQHTTNNIANKGFSDLRKFVARFNFSCTVIGNRPQSLTGHIVKR